MTWRCRRPPRVDGPRRRPRQLHDLVVVAAADVLSIVVEQRDGHEVELTPAFRKHLNTRWIKFAADVIDSFLTFGLAVVAFDEDKDLVRQRRRLPGALTGPLLAPLVPPLECIDVAVAPAGRLGYAREYSVYTRSATHHARRDDDARVHVRDKPDAAGNLVSPTSACFDSISFVNCLQELALTAEVTNSRVHVFTQQVRASGTEAASPFAFDALSREVATDLDTEANVAAAEALAHQLQLTRVLNRLQTTRQPEPARGRSVARGDQGQFPPEIPASFFLAPKGQQIVHPGTRPQARGDLEQCWLEKG